ncbi:MAG: D-Ala-D-Ala carboxypeptidase family metallohydrolase [Cetobacterium sp.]
MAWKEGYFSSAEFACQCGCGAGTDREDISDELLFKLNQLRLRVGPLTLTSGARCVAHNTAEGGKLRSAHVCIPGETPCRAVDIRVRNAVHKKALIDGIVEVGFKRRGEANTFVHVDVGQAPTYPQDVVWYYS